MRCASMCASPSDGRRSRRPRGAQGALVAVALLAGCIAGVRTAYEARYFDHATHAEEMGCVDCHEGAEDEDRAGMPDGELCSDCHDPDMDDEGVTARIKAYGKASGDGARWPSPAVRGPSYADVTFSHAVHVGGVDVACTECHPGAEESAAANPGGPMAMAACERCHEERGAPSGCATCHERLARDTRPPNHGAGWPLHHGPVSRNPDPGRVQEQCSLCHTQSDCDSCHAQTEPRDHTDAFRVATHGLAAAIDRSRCMACHQSDSCERCHEVSPPRSHRAGWGSPRDRHCFACHLPVSGEGCVVCHKGTPSHEALSPPQPAWHTPALDCRECHPTHPDNGQDCNLCHR